MGKFTDCLSLSPAKRIRISLIYLYLFFFNRLNVSVFEKSFVFSGETFRVCGTRHDCVRSSEIRGNFRLLRKVVAHFENKILGFFDFNILKIR